MYVIKVERTGQMRSWHQETPAGLRRAIEECEMRTHGTNTPHIVTDNNGLRLHLSLPHEVKRRLEQAKARRGWSYDRWLTIVGLTLLLLAVFSPR